MQAEGFGINKNFYLCRNVAQKLHKKVIFNVCICVISFRGFILSGFSQPRKYSYVQKF